MLFIDLLILVNFLMDKVEAAAFLLFENATATDAQLAAIRLSVPADGELI